MSKNAHLVENIGSIFLQYFSNIVLIFKFSYINQAHAFTKDNERRISIVGSRFHFSLGMTSLVRMSCALGLLDC